MYELPEVIPDVEVLLALQPEELAAKLVFLFQRHLERDPNWKPRFANIEPEPFRSRDDSVAPYPDTRREQVSVALAEAWSWLEAQGLLVPAPGTNGANGFRVLSRRARAFVDERDFTNFVIARRLPADAMHPRLASAVWLAFMRGDYDVAAFQAMKTVEIAVRDAAGLSAGDIGVPLMRRAFDITRGPLTDMEAEASERQARQNLFAGATGSYKNPHSHRDVQLDSAGEAIEIIMLANHLLRIVDARREVRKT
jgi:uncharacterized protein (TIGR02391 family)